MIKIIKHTMGIMLISLTMINATIASEEANLTDEQLHAFLGIITSFILSDESIFKLNAPTLSTDVPTKTRDRNVTVEVNGDVNSTVWLNGVEIATIGEEGNVSVLLVLNDGNNSFSITLKDSKGNESDALIIRIEKITNIAPTAKAGITQSKKSGEYVILDGSNSADIDGTINAYSWVLTSSNPTGITLSLVNANTSKASFTAPEVNATTVLTFSLSVTDNDGLIDTDSVSITIEPNTERLYINEISSAYYTNDDRWFEIYNPTSVDIDISSYTLKSHYYDGSNSGIFEFALPSKTIPSKGYLIVKSNYGPAFNTTLMEVENNEVIYLKDTASKKYPIWYSNYGGFLEILKDGKTIDFVSIDDDTVPVSTGEWVGVNVPTFTTNGEEFWKSIARDINSTDTNSASDWTVSYFPTYAGLNDVTCNEDLDQDGIPDCSEVSGSTYAGMDLYAYGARTNQKDIFIEVDYMDSTNNGALAIDEGVIPRIEALDKVRTAFADNNFTVHFDVGDLFAQNGSTIDPSQMDLGGGNEVPYALSVSLNPSDASNVYTIKKDNMQTSRRQIFHYMLFGTSQEVDGSGGSSGIAEKPGNDSIMTLGGWGLNSHTQTDKNRLINYQAGTVMHEFGHNLGLGHGGDEDKNYKPNYLSVMNYLYQLSGLPTIGDNEGDRYYAEKGGSCQNSGLTNPASGDYLSFKLDYSHGISSNLDEVNGIDEENGLGRNGSNPVDYNCNNNTENTLTNFNLNTSYDTVLDTLHDYNDWAALNIIFARTYNGNNGVSTSTTSNKPNIPNPIFNDVQPVALEYKFKIAGEVR